MLEYNFILIIDYIASLNKYFVNSSSEKQKIVSLINYSYCMSMPLTIYRLRDGYRFYPCVVQVSIWRLH